MNHSADIRIIGIDPGLNTTGWGIILCRGSLLVPLDHGKISPNTKGTLAERLRALYQGLVEVILRHQPEVAAVEKTFVNVNPASALTLGMARGVVLLAPAEQNVPVFEYSATCVKKTVVGVGCATKDQVASMVQRLLPCAKEAKADAADALAIAICHAHHRSFHRYTEACA